MKTFLIILGFIMVIGFVVIMGQEEEIREIEVIVTKKTPYSDKKVAVGTVGGYIYIFYKEDAEPFHPGGIYWIKYKSGRVLDFRKLGDLNVISLDESQIRGKQT